MASAGDLPKTEGQLVGMDVSGARKLKTLESENARLKRHLADAHLDIAALKDVLGKG